MYFHQLVTPLLAQDAARRGLLPTRGTWMLDFVVLAMLIVIPIMIVSIYLVRFHRKYRFHKQVQLTLGILLLVTIAAFEIDMRILSPNWRELAQASPFYSSGLVQWSLLVHLCFAIPTLPLWVFVIVQALRKFPTPPEPCEYSQAHIYSARLAAVGMILTAVTGWVFYWLAFVA